MNCQTARVKVTEQLAADLSPLPPDLSAHFADCRVCQDFYQAQRALYVNIDSGLRNLVNQTAPVSLVPSVRARLEDIPVSNTFSMPVWAFAAAALALVFSITMLWRQGGNRTSVPETVPIASVVTPALSAEPGTQSRTPKASAARRRGPRAVVMRNSQAATPEVIILQEERDAYARFVAKRFQEHTPAPWPAPSASSDAAVEISLLRIKGVEIEPLDSAAEQSR